MADETRARWTKLVADFEASGLTQREYAKERGVSFSNLRNWIYRLRNETRPLAETKADKRTADSDLRLLPVQVVASAPKARLAEYEGGIIEVMLPSGARLRFLAGIDPTYVRALIGGL